MENKNKQYTAQTKGCCSTRAAELNYGKIVEEIVVVVFVVMSAVEGHLVLVRVTFRSFAVVVFPVFCCLPV